MNQIMKRITQGLALSLIVLAGSSIVAVPEAAAHGFKESRHVGYHDYGYRRRLHAMPRWLRADRDFRHWYFHLPRRFVRRMSWSRLYDLYLFETRRVHRSWYRRYDRRYFKNDDWFYLERERKRERNRDRNRRRRS